VLRQVAGIAWCATALAFEDTPWATLADLPVHAAARRPPWRLAVTGTGPTVCFLAYSLHYPEGGGTAGCSLTGRWVCVTSGAG